MHGRLSVNMHMEYIVKKEPSVATRQAHYNGAFERIIIYHMTYHLS
jgi:hypothetical protein